MRTQKLLTKEIERKIPSRYEQEKLKLKDRKAYAKFFVACATWYALEYDKEEKIFFGLADLGYGYEMGYFSLTELEELKVRQPLIIGGQKRSMEIYVERDKFFSPTRLEDIDDNRLAKYLNRFDI